MAARFLFRLLQEDAEQPDHHQAAEEEQHVDHGKPWGSIIGAALVVQAATLSGLMVVALVALYRTKTGQHQFTLRQNQHIMPLISSFAAGSLSATVVFLVVPEALELLLGSHAEEEESALVPPTEETSDEHADHVHMRGLLVATMRRLNETTIAMQDETAHDHEQEVSGTWKFGTFFLVGLLIPLLIGVFFPSAEKTLEELEQQEQEQARPVLTTSTNTKTLPVHPTSLDEVLVDEEPTSATVIVTGTTRKGNNSDDPTTAPSHEPENGIVRIKDLPMHIVNPQLAISVLIGDFFHNFADGIFIGTAFLLCDSSLAWTLAATTVYHELAQEISDFLLLTEFCNFSIFKALLCNFLSGFSVVLGAVIVAELNFSDIVVGCILAVSAGVYTYIAVAECIPKMGKSNRMVCLVVFVLGAVPIGLVLLNHRHCESGHDH